MKNLFASVFLFVVLGLSAQAQSRAIEQFFNNHEGEGGITFLEMKGNLLQMMLQADQDEEGKEMAEKITGFRLMASNKKEGGPRFQVRPAELEGLVRSLRSEGFVDLMTVREDGDHVEIIGKRKGKETVTDLAIVVNGNDGFAFINLSGEFDYKKVDKVLKNIEFDGKEHLGAEH
jgi:hypothetical protein